MTRPARQLGGEPTKWRQGSIRSSRSGGAGDWSMAGWSDRARFRPVARPPPRACRLRGKAADTSDLIRLLL